PELILGHDWRSVDHRFFGVPREGQPTRATAGDTFEHLEETLEVACANAVIDASVEHHIIRSTEIHPRRISDAKVNVHSGLPCFLARPSHCKVDEIDRGHTVSAASECDGVRPRTTPDLEDGFPGQQTRLEDTIQFRARHAGIPWRVAGPVCLFEFTAAHLIPSGFKTHMDGCLLSARAAEESSSSRAEKG